MARFHLSNEQQGEKSWAGFFLFWDLRLGFRDALSRPLMGMRPRRDMDTPMRQRITRRRRLAWGSGLVVGDVVGGEGEGVAIYLAAAGAETFPGGGTISAPGNGDPPRRLPLAGTLWLLYVAGGTPLWVCETAPRHHRCAADTGPNSKATGLEAFGCQPPDT